MEILNHNILVRFFITTPIHNHYVAIPLHLQSVLFTVTIYS